ncbi:hypothetical protein EXM22_06695 [Oceanispirochaeta crateris]|uniref:Exo-alpha-sialidase n=1 Tax=Oceanispirochaeta crateris TaxID=2518645 RepID=A0A5C1QJA0_9SPIO|nr:hypothetical protein [Oceanispirochaeta crateris]QEN07691.1 hypothetical protein EXM22_06695 [Oceanispirochaeta crateris]
MKKLYFIPLVLLFLMSCSGSAIFYTLENEEEIRDTNNFKSTTPVNRILLYDDGLTESYVTHGKQLWYSTAGSDQNPWSSLSLPDGYSDSAVVNSVATFGTRLYATVADGDSDSKSALMYVESIDDSLTEVFSDTSREGSDSDDYYFYELSLFSVNDGLYISRTNRLWSTQSSSNSSIEETELYYYPSGDYPPSSGLDDSHLVSISGMTDEPFIIKDIVSTGAAGDIFLILNETGSDADSYNAGMLFKTSWSTPETFSSEMTITVDSTTITYSFNRLYYASDYGALFLSTRTDGSYHPILYTFDDGASWESLTGSSNIQFSAFQDISGIDSSTNIILAGTRADVIEGSSTYYTGSGYYEIDMSDTSDLALQSNTFALDTNYSSTDLYDSTIMDILYDSTRNKIYASTSSNGLWMNDYSDDDDARIWYRE